MYAFKPNRFYFNVTTPLIIFCFIFKFNEYSVLFYQISIKKSYFLNNESLIIVIKNKAIYLVFDN